MLNDRSKNIHRFCHQIGSFDAAEHTRLSRAAFVCADCIKSWLTVQIEGKSSSLEAISSRVSRMPSQRPRCQSFRNSRVSGQSWFVVALLIACVYFLMNRMAVYSPSNSILPIGSVQSLSRNHAGAVESFEEALKIYEATCGRRHASTADALRRLGSSFSDFGQLEKARQAMQQRLQILVDIHTEQHPEVAMAYIDLGMLFAKQDEDKAVDLVKRGVEILQQSTNKVSPADVCQLSC